MIPVPAPAGPGAFVHPALFYRDLDEYVTGVGGFVRTALAADEPVLVAVPGPRLDALRESLDPGGGSGITWTDMTELGRNPGRILAALQDFADRNPGRPARIVGEPIWPGRSAAEVLEATRHEALINTAFAGRPATVLCPYDVVGLAPAVVRDARRTHPTLLERGRDLPSPGYTGLPGGPADLDRPLPEPDGPVARLAYARGGLAEVREYAEGWGRRTGLTPARRGDLIMAISEAAANSLSHGGGKGTLRLWTVDGPAAGVVAEIHDDGRLADPLAGRRRPSLASAHGGRGLWMIHQLCDLVEIRATESGLTLRLHVATP
ncbi:MULTISPECIES: sensor histidine kinase [Streptomyces]|nr:MULTISPECIES: sensor histidine kinase [Streptomyces]KOU82432.1 regulator [Streptomyces sp. XY593]MBP2341761.1 anti-sigma regulatory factor (Ser/Thr protein kinase) [Streptomyces virginiae]MCI4079465.1 sensor histidine kinase [Streptomyces sp. MMS21 TC-5]QNE29348.1 sensor histidine kinase [Streptomyces sp. INR7]